MLDALFSRLLKFYLSLEDGYYEFMDSLEGKKLPVYRFFIAPLETHGLPSFPVFILFLLLLLGGAFSIYSMAFPQPVEFRVVVFGNTGSSFVPLNGATVQLLDNGRVIATAIASNGVAIFSGTPVKQLEVKASAGGFGDTAQLVDVSESSSVRLQLNCTSGACGETVAQGDSETPLIEFQAATNSCNPSSASGSLFVSAFASGKAVEGVARVYENYSHGLIATVRLVQGQGFVSSLPVGSRVFAMVQGNDGLALDGSSSVVEIKPCDSKILLDFDSSKAMQSVIQVSSAGKNLQGARVRIFKSGTLSPLFSGESDSEGKVAARLVSGKYFAVADKEGFFWGNSNYFEAGQNESVFLSAFDAGKATLLTANVLTPRQEAVSNALVSLIAKMEGGDDYFVLFDGLTSLNGITFSLRRGGQTDAFAFFKAMTGKTLGIAASDASQSVSITLDPMRVSVHAFAVEPISGNSVSAPRFTSQFLGSNYSCVGNGCLLTVPLDFAFQVSSSASGFLPFSDSLVLSQADKNLTVYLVSEELLKDSYVKLLRVVDSEGKEVPQAGGWLSPGTNYAALFQLATKDALESGIVFSTGSDEVQIIGNSPQAPASKQLGFALACEPEQANYQSGTAYSTVDLLYAGAVNQVIAFNFTVPAEIALDPLTKSKVINFTYRSYIIRDGQYVRNPFDRELLGKAGSQLKSGCTSPAFEKKLEVRSPTTTCTDFACVSLSFNQGGNEGSAGFEAQSLSNLVENESEYTPLFLYYQVDLLKPFTGALSLNFSSSPLNLLALTATNPVGEFGSSCDFENGLEQRVFSSSFALDLSNLSSCTNFFQPSPGNPLTLKGVISAKPLSGTNHTDLSLTLLGEAVPTAHYTWMKIIGNEITANELGIFEANLTQDFNSYVGDEPYPAYNVASCSESEIESEKCDYGFLNTRFLYTSLRPRKVNVSVSFDPAVFKLAYANINGTVIHLGEEGLSKGGYSNSFDLPVEGTLYGNVKLIPVKDTSLTSIFAKAQVITQESSIPLEIQRNVTVSKGLAYENSSLFPNGTDTCNGVLDLRYNPSLVPPLQVGKKCGDLSMLVSNLLPADAVPLNISMPDYDGNIFVRTVETDGSDACYEICETDGEGNPFSCTGLEKEMQNGVSYLLRYYPDSKNLNCPQRFKPEANTVPGSKVTLQFAYSLDASARRNVTIHVFNTTSVKALFVSPVLTFYEQKAFERDSIYPQLWAVINQKQIGTRRILVDKPSSLRLDFNGPGVKYFSYYPNSGHDPLIVYDFGVSDSPIYHSDNTTNAVPAQSEYVQALASFLVQPGAVAPQFLENSYDNLVTQASQNSYFNPNAFEKVVSDAKAASALLYWRDKSLEMYCQNTPACVSSNYGLQNCCKLSIEDWKNYSTIQDFKLESCTYCNNTANPSCTNQTFEHLQNYLSCSNEVSASNSYQCDQRCVAKAPLVAAKPQLAAILHELGANGDYVTYTNTEKNHLGIDYGENFGNQQCVFKYSSPNKFVRYSASQSSQFAFYGQDGFFPYNPLSTVKSLSQTELSTCTNQASCPLVLTGDGKAQCTEDENQDGYYSPGESLEQANPSGDSFNCPVNSQVQGIIAVSAEVQNNDATALTKIAPRKYVTDFEMQNCKKGLCPLAIGTEVGSNHQLPWCFTDSNANRFLDLDVASEALSLQKSSYLPATLQFRKKTSDWDVYSCPSGKTIAIVPYCASSCTNQCASPNCDPLCTSQGNKAVPNGEPQKIFQNWLNQSEVSLKTLKPFNGKALAPFSYFTDVTAEGDAKYSHSFTVDTRFTDKPFNQVNLDDVLGCNSFSDTSEEAGTEFPNQGLYTVNTVFDPAENWTTKASVATVAKDAYASKNNRCNIGKEARLCNLAFGSFSQRYGACLNSILQYADGTLKAGTTELPFLTPLGYGNKNAIGYGVTKTGAAFALVGHEEKLNVKEGTNICNYYYQDFDAWKPDGSLSGHKQLEWKECSSAAGKKKGAESIIGLILGLVLTLLTGGGGAGALGALGGAGGAAGAGALAAGGLGGGGGFGQIFGMLGSLMQGSGQQSDESTFQDSQPTQGGGCKQWDPVAANAGGDAFVSGCKNLSWQIIKK